MNPDHYLRLPPPPPSCSSFLLFPNPGPPEEAKESVRGAWVLLRVSPSRGRGGGPGVRTPGLEEPQTPRLMGTGVCPIQSWGAGAREVPAGGRWGRVSGSCFSQLSIWPSLLVTPFCAFPVKEAPHPPDSWSCASVYRHMCLTGNVWWHSAVGGWLCLFPVL